MRSENHLIDGQTYRLTKRLGDIILSAGLLIILSPVLLLIALAIKLDSKGPVVFPQIRCGYRKKLFTIYKFRTLYRHCSCYKGGEQVADEGDIRLTPIGGFLRRYSLDELPQLFNILKGDMSFVGPRPHAVSHHRYYQQQIPHYNQRLAVTPGLTGLAQVEGWRGPTPQITQMARRFDYDLAYIRQCCLWLDLRILLLTVWRGSWREK
ncbi:MAG TPA: sugar transferase [Alphaproteobacteria bacterium]